MYFVGIDMSKYKHDCFICTETGEVICDNSSFQNTNEGFSQLLNLLKSLDNTKSIRIGFEATGHYGMNLKLFLEKNNYSFMEFNPPPLSIKKIDIISCAGIISEFDNISRFKSADAMVAFAGIEPSISQSSTESHAGHMVKQDQGI